jgi:hypothetical protein
MINCRYKVINLTFRGFVNSCSSCLDLCPSLRDLLLPSDAYRRVSPHYRRSLEPAATDPLGIGEVSSRAMSTTSCCCRRALARERISSVSSGVNVNRRPAWLRPSLWALSVISVTAHVRTVRSEIATSVARSSHDRPSS